jgi:hypothetical protein
MASLYNANLKPLAPGVATHPYDHATKLFLSDNFRLAPKQSFLYYVCINVDVGILQNMYSNMQSIGDPASSQTLVEQYETGLLAKRVDLPKFSMGTRTMNAYNRKNIIQTNISYDPISITFHDDAADTVVKFWNDYYTYYYRDSDYDSSLYSVPHKYQPRLRDGWGFSPRNGTVKSFIRNIQIFSLHNKRFTEYLLVNPYITQWRHGDHNSYGGGEIMEAQMSVAYETVKYRTGYVNPVDVNGFSVLHYDNFNSPISTSTTNIYTDAGVLGALGGASTDLARPDGTGSGTGLLGDVLGAYRTYNQLKGANFSSLAKVTLGQVGGKLLAGLTYNAINGLFVPTAGGAAGYGGVYGSSQVYSNSGLLSSSPYGSPQLSFGATINGVASSIINGAVNMFSSTTNSWARGIASPSIGSAPTIAATSVYQLQGSTGATPIYVDAQGKPVTSQTSYTSYDTDGNPISTQTTRGDATQTYDPTDKYKNLTALTTSVGQDGQPVYTYVYQDGTVRTVNDDLTQEQIRPGSNYGKPLVPFAPPNTRDAAAAGQPTNPAAVQYYTGPDGKTYVVNASTAQATNKLAQGAGAIGGTLVGVSLYQKLAGKSVLGQYAAAGVSSAIAMQTNKLVTQGLTPIFNQISKDFSQGIDNLTGDIKNKVGSFFGSGGYDPKAPLDNMQSKYSDEQSTTFYSYKDGTIRSVDAEGVQSVTPGTNSGWNWPTFGGTTPGINADANASYNGSMSGAQADLFYGGDYGGPSTALSVTSDINSYSGIDYSISAENDAFAGLPDGYGGNEIA